MEKRSDARANKDRVIEAAQEVFAEKGITAEIKEIAERAGVGVGTIYRNFPAKDDLIAEIVRGAGQQMEQCVADGEQESDPVLGLRTTLARLFTVVEQYGWLVDALFSDQLPPAAKAETRRHSETEKNMGLYRLLRRGIDEGRLRTDLNVDIAAAFIAGTVAPWNLSRIRIGRTPQEAANEVIDLLLKGAARNRPV